MIIKLLRNDFRRNILINLSLLLFILLPALILSSTVSLILLSAGAIDNLFDAARVPHFVQMHSGAWDEGAGEEWARANPLVRDYQVAEMLSVDKNDLYFRGESASLHDSVMDLGFLSQNENFDFLLDENNHRLNPGRGEIAVPLYFKEKAKLRLGDSLEIRRDSFHREFRITAFVRDGQMNPPIVHSKRFVVNREDYLQMKGALGETEYLIEFLLNDEADLDGFIHRYEASGLPGNGPAVNIRLFKLLNMISSGITAVSLVFISLLFSIVALLCLRFALLGSLEEDYTDIGVMKAIGLPLGFAKGMYFLKYGVIAGAASLSGFLLSWPLTSLLTGKIRLYMGEVPPSFPSRVLSLSGALVVLLIVLGSVALLLGRINAVSPVSALRHDRSGDRGAPVLKMPLSGFRLLGINLILGLRALLLNGRFYLLLGLVYFVGAFIVLVPANMYNTVNSPTFITYLGMGPSDIRIDLRGTEHIRERYEELLSKAAADGDIDRFAGMVTGRYEAKNPEGEWESINVETGDFSLFPLGYLKGEAPLSDGEIALSSLNARKFDKGIGDTLLIRSGEGERVMAVSGIYQDITNGGYTAKAAGPPPADRVLWYVVHLGLASGEKDRITEKAGEYGSSFRKARVSPVGEYVNQTLGSVVGQLKLTADLAAYMALLVMAVITVLFQRLMLSRESGSIAVMRTLGFSRWDIRKQYLYRLFLLSLSGFLLGTLMANSLGERMVGLIWSGMGASRIDFVPDRFRSYLLYPLAMGLTLFSAVLVSSGNIKEKNISAMNAE